jgi:hypothetical protein
MKIADAVLAVEIEQCLCKGQGRLSSAEKSRSIYPSCALRVLYYCGSRIVGTSSILFYLLRQVTQLHVPLNQHTTARRGIARGLRAVECEMFAWFPDSFPPPVLFITNTGLRQGNSMSLLLLYTSVILDSVVLCSNK